MSCLGDREKINGKERGINYYLMHTYSNVFDMVNVNGTKRDNLNTVGYFNGCIYICNTINEGWQIM